MYADSLSNLAHVYDDLGKDELAKETYLKSMEIFKNIMLKEDT